MRKSFLNNAFHAIVSNMEKQETFGRWTVITTGSPKSLCRCECGTERMVVTKDMERGVSKSCGCLSRERTSARSKIVNRIHGMDGTPIYRIWIDMRRRCNKSQRPDYHRYGGRGIKVCDAWNNPKGGFEVFYSEMGDRPSANHSIEREDNDGPYCKANCTWATKKQQGANTRTNRLMTVNGITLSVTAMADAHNLKPHTVFNRLNRGMSDGDAVAPVAGIASPRDRSHRA